MAQYGIDKLVEELNLLGFNAEKATGSDNQNYAIIKSFEISLGRFQGRIIDLGVPVPNDYPRLIGSSIHIKANPQLLEQKDSISGVRNIIESKLGTEWKYWSFRLNIVPENPAQNIINQINGIFYRI